MLLAHLDSPGWYQGAALSSSSSSSITGGTLLDGGGSGGGAGDGHDCFKMDFSEFERRSAKTFDLLAPMAAVADAEVLLLFLRLFMTELPLKSLMRQVMLPAAVSFLMMLRLFRLLPIWNEGEGR